MSDGVYSEGGVFDFEIDSIEKDASSGGADNARFIFRVKTTANSGDWFVNRTNNSALNPPAFKLKLVFDDSLKGFKGFDAENTNPIYNNVNDSRLSTVFMDIDYNSGVIVPTNIKVIEDKTALKAPIQDSNYTQAAWKNGRYDGSRVSSTDFNK